jgi:hypothetical protein
MGLLVIVLFATAWASILLSGEYRVRREISGTKSVRTFERTMSKLARHCRSGTPPVDPSPPGRHVLVPASPVDAAVRRSRARMRARQHAILAQLGSVTAVAGGLAVLVGDVLRAVFLVSASALAVYILLIARVRAREAERFGKVRALRRPHRRAAPSQRDTGQHVRTQRRVV